MRWITAKLSEGADRYIKEETPLPPTKEEVVTTGAYEESSIIDLLGINKEKPSYWTAENIILAVALLLLTVVVVHRQRDQLF